MKTVDYKFTQLTQQITILSEYTGLEEEILNLESIIWRFYALPSFSGVNN